LVSPTSFNVVFFSFRFSKLLDLFFFHLLLLFSSLYSHLLFIHLKVFFSFFFFFFFWSCCQISFCKNFNFSFSEEERNEAEEEEYKFFWLYLKEVTIWGKGCKVFFSSILKHRMNNVHFKKWCSSWEKYETEIKSTNFDESLYEVNYSSFWYR
jgi:hypothetical protein